MNYTPNYYPNTNTRTSPTRPYQNNFGRPQPYQSPTSTRPMSPNPSRQRSPFHLGSQNRPLVNTNYNQSGGISKNKNGNYLNHLNSPYQPLNHASPGNFKNENYGASPIRNYQQNYGNTGQTLYGSQFGSLSNYTSNRNITPNSSAYKPGVRIRRGDELRKSIEKRRQNLGQSGGLGGSNQRLSSNFQDVIDIRKSGMLTGSNYIPNYNANPLNRSGINIIQPKPNIENSIPRANVVIGPPNSAVPPQNIPEIKLTPSVAQVEKPIEIIHDPQVEPIYHAENEITGSRYYRGSKNNEQESPKKEEMNQNAFEAFNKIFEENSYFGQFTDDPTYIKEHNFEALKFLEVVSKSQGVIFIWDYGAFIYKINEDNKVVVKKIGPRK